MRRHSPPPGFALSRRQFLSGMTAGVASLPFMALQRSAYAANGERPTRLVCFPMINGAPCGGHAGTLPHHLFWPTDMGLLSPVTAPLMNFAQHLTFIRGMWLEGAFNHSAIRSIYTGAFLGQNDYDNPPVRVASIDQIIAQRIQSSALPTPIRSLHLAAAPADHIGLYKGGRSTFFFNEGGVALDYEANPVTAYDELFRAAANDDPARLALRARLRSRALAIGAAEIGTLETRVAGLEREAVKLRRYREALRDLSMGGAVAPPMAVDCAAPLVGAVDRLRPNLAGNPAAAYDGQYYPDIVEAQFEIMAHALVCGMTRVATLQVSSADNSQNAIVPVNTAAGTRMALHAASHEPDQDYYGECQRWYAQKLADFMTRLDVPDPLCPAGNTVLHNTVILWMSESHPVDHGSHRLPMAYLGSAGGALRVGTVIDLDPVPDGPEGRIARGHHDLESGPTHKAFLKTICRAFGVPDAETGQLGDDVIAEMLV